jgi:hypothetical protein
MAETAWNETTTVLFWASWLILLYLAWPRLVSLCRNMLRKRSAGKPVKLIVPPVWPKWDLRLENSLGWATLFFFGLSVLELFLRRPQFERFSLSLFGLCLGLTLLMRAWRNHFRHGPEKSEILFPHVPDNTAIGMGLIKVPDLLGKLRHIASELARKEEAHKEIATQLLELVESARVFLSGIRLEPFDSNVLRQAQPLFIRLETLVAAFELLARLSDATELHKVSNEAIGVLSSAKVGFEALQVKQSLKLIDQLDNLIAVLRHLYKPAP